MAAYISPRLELESDWGRHALNLMLAADEFIYFDQSAANRTNVYGSADGKVDITRDFNWTGGVSGGLFEEQIGDFNTIFDAAEPTRYTTVNTWSTLTKSFNRIEVSIGGSYNYFHYFDVETLDGVSVDQDFRDGDVIEGGGRVSYLMSRRVAASSVTFVTTGRTTRVCR